LIVADAGFLLGNFFGELPQLRNCRKPFFAEKILPDFGRIGVVQDEAIVLNDPDGLGRGLNIGR
jgi:hypothetical protein